MAPESRSDAPAPAEEHLRDLARSHFDRGMEHFRAYRFREAVREFELSAARVPSAELWFDIARAHEQLGEFGLAVENYRRYLRDRVDAPDASEVEARIATLEARASQASTLVDRRTLRGSLLAIDAPAAGAVLLLDGRQLGTTPFDRILEVESGSHRIEAQRAGYLPFRAEVVVAPGALSVAVVDLRPATRTLASPRNAVWPWIAASTSAAALLSSSAFGIAALHERDARDLPSARRWARASDLALGTALVAAVTALLLYAAEPPGAKVALAMRPSAVRGTQ